MLGGSKKDSKLRRSEVLGSGSTSLAHHLCQLCTAQAADMLRDPLACDTVIEVAQGGSEGDTCLLMCTSGCCYYRLHAAVSSDCKLLLSPMHMYSFVFLSKVDMWYVLIVSTLWQCGGTAGMLAEAQSSGVQEVQNAIASAAAADLPSASMQGMEP